MCDLAYVGDRECADVGELADALGMTIDQVPARNEMGPMQSDWCLCWVDWRALTTLTGRTIETDAFGTRCIAEARDG